jgi:hypothetical protein
MAFFFDKHPARIGGASEKCGDFSHLADLQCIMNQRDFGARAKVGLLP